MVKIFKNFTSRINHVWVMQKYFLNFFSKTKLTCEQYEKKNFSQLIWEILRSKVGKKNFKLIFLIKVFDKKIFMLET